MNQKIMKIETTDEINTHIHKQIFFFWVEKLVELIFLIMLYGK